MRYSRVVSQTYAPPCPPGEQTSNSASLCVGPVGAEMVSARFDAKFSCYLATAIRDQHSHKPGV
jgi:hypothetical protein